MQMNMKATCLNCHTNPSILKFYREAETVVKSTNAAVKDAEKVIKSLRDEGLLTPEPFDEPIEYVYFDLWHYYGRTAKHGAFMGGADFVQWHGFYELTAKTVELNKMAEESFTGPTTEDATKAAWQAFKRRLPEGLRPDGDAPTAEAQEKKWGADDPATLFRKLMAETKRARDNSGWHTPDQSLKESRGDDRIDELSKGNSQIGEHKSEKVIKDAWDRLTKT